MAGGGGGAVGTDGCTVQGRRGGRTSVEMRPGFGPLRFLVHVGSRPCKGEGGKQKPSRDSPSLLVCPQTVERCCGVLAGCAHAPACCSHGPVSQVKKPSVSVGNRLLRDRHLCQPLGIFLCLSATERGRGVGMRAPCGAANLPRAPRHERTLASRAAPPTPNLPPAGRAESQLETKKGGTVQAV